MLGRCVSRPSTCGRWHVGGYMLQSAHSDEASCEGDGGFWMAEEDDMGTCTDVNLQGKAACEAPGVCTMDPTKSRVYADRQTRAQSQSARGGAVRTRTCVVAKKCCQDGCIAHVEFVGKYGNSSAPGAKREKAWGGFTT